MLLAEHTLDNTDLLKQNNYLAFNPQMPKVFRQPKRFLPSRPNFLEIFLMGEFSGSRNPTVIMIKFCLYCMT